MTGGKRDENALRQRLAVSGVSRRSLLVASAIGIAIPASDALAYRGMATSNAPVLSDLSINPEGWANWQVLLLRKAHKSRLLLRKGWVPDSTELGISWLRIKLQRPDGEYSFSMRPQGLNRQISIQTKSTISPDAVREESVTGDWEGRATRYSDVVVPSQNAPIRLMCGWESKGDKWDATAATSRKQDIGRGNHYASYLSLLGEERKTKNAYLFMRSSLRYRSLLVHLAEAVELLLPESLRDQLELESNVTRPALREQYQELAARRLELERRLKG